MASKRGPTHPWRDNIEAMTVAIIMAVVLKYFVIEAYKIPTGSMQPTLMGQRWNGGGVFDRILVDKLSYHFRDPERFEVVIFKYPLDRSKNFVKRLVGMPGEQLRIARGDVWLRDDEEQEWKVQRRPRNVQLETWKSIDLGLEAGFPLWGADDDEAASWRIDGREISAGGPGAARFIGHGGGTASINDRYKHGYPPAIYAKLTGPDVGSNACGDLRLTGEVRAQPGCSLVSIELDDGPLRHRFEIPGPAAEVGARARVVSAPVIHGSSQPSGEAEGGAIRLSAGKAMSFAVQNIDDLLSFELDGELVCELEVPAAETPRSAIRVRLEGGGADFEDLRAFRDIYYLPGSGGPEWEIPDGHYFMLGDNTQDSSDSREWTWYVLAWDGPGSEGAPVRGNRRIARLGPAPPDSNPIENATFGEMLTWFRDEWGELHIFPTATKKAVLGGSSGQHAPFVPRELITGRALLVFWPIKPWQGITRLKWIH